MNRQAQYTKDSRHRMISVANGRWQVQAYQNFKGTRTVDPWRNVGVALDRTAAFALLNQFEPIRYAA